MNVMQKRFMMVFLVFVLLVGSYSGLIVTGGTVYAADDFAGGNGTTGSPFQIESSDQLNNVRDYLGSHFILNNDIDMSVFDADHPWEPIGNKTTPFTGSLDGRNFKITNLIINAPSSGQPVGLFSVVGGTNSFIKNLTIDAVEVRGLDYVGILAGKNSSTIHNVGVAGSVYGENFVGGLTGASENSNISNSYATGVINGYNDVGGLSGRMDNGVASYSYASGNVSGSVDVGGFVGKQENAVVSYSYAVGNVVGCVDIGGLVGDNGDSRVSNSFATGAVTGSCELGYQSDTVGGLVGDNSDGDIEFSYAIGRVSGDYLVGGLVGIDGNGYVHGNFYDRDTTGQSDVSGKGLTSDEMKDWRNYTGWDFDTVWDMQAPHHYGYPYVKAVQAFVTYAGNGTDDSSEPYSSQSYLPGSLVEIQGKSRDWTKAGYRFNGWNTKADGSGDTYRIQDTVKLSGNLLLYADWKQPAVPTLTTPVNDQYTSISSPLISGTADGGVTVVIILDRSEAATVMAADDGSWSWTPPSALSEGAHTVQARAIDAAGNLSALTAARTFTVDTIAPTAVISNTGGGTVNAAFPVTITFSEAVQGLTENDMVIENGTVSDLVTVTSVTYSATVSPTTSGQAVKVTVAAGAVTDAAGNANPQSNQLLVQYDKTKPVATFGNYTHGQLFNVPPAAVTVSVTEAVYWIAGGAELDAMNALPLIGMKKDGAAFTAYTASFDALAHVFTLSFNSTPQDGVYEVEVAGNVVRNVYHNALDTARASFIVDTQPPVITLVGGVSIVLTAGDPFVDPGATATDSFEGDLPASVTGSVNNQVPGIYTLQYNAQDSAGNAAVPVMRTVQVNARNTGSTGGGSVPQSNNADLNQLTLRANGDELKLSPTFAADTTSYRVTTSADEVTIEAAASDGKAVVTLGGTALGEGKTVALAMGDNVFEIIVKAENGTAKTYSLTIERRAELTPPSQVEIPACTFLDIKRHWAEQHICKAAEKGIVKGNSATEFAPQGLVTRVEFAAMLLRTLGVAPAPAADKLTFTDQDQIPTWAITTVSDAVEIGLLKGYPDGSLRPMHTVSRSEMATMLTRAMNWDIEQGKMTSFADDADIPKWAKGYIYAAVQRGLLNGREGNQFSPAQPATRAEAATTLLRLWHVLDDMPSKSRD